MADKRVPIDDQWVSPVQTYAVVVEDNDDDREDMVDVAPVGRIREMRPFSSREDFLDNFLDPNRRAPYQDELPGVFFLDLRLQGRDSGFEILEAIRRSKRLRKIPTIIVSSSDEAKDIERAYKAGANFYVVKGDSPRQLKDAIKRVLRAIDRGGRVPADYA